MILRINTFQYAGDILSRRRLRQFEKRIYYRNDFYDSENLFTENHSNSKIKLSFKLYFQKTFRQLAIFLFRMIHRIYLTIWFALYFVVSQFIRLVR